MYVSEETARRIDEALNRPPVVLVSSYDRWMRLFNILLSVVAIVLMLLAVSKFSEVVTELIKNRAIDCRSLVVDGAELDTDGPCFDQEVLRYYDPDTGRSR